MHRALVHGSMALIQLLNCPYLSMGQVLLTIPSMVGLKKIEFHKHYSVE